MKSWQDRADAAIAQGCNTYSRRNDQFIRGVMRTHVRGGDGAFLILDDGRRVVDHTCGLGSNILSACNNYGLPTTDEVVLAEMLKKRFPFVDKWKLTRTGSDACTAAVRIARGYIQNLLKRSKDFDVKGYGIGYHGQSNTFISAENPGMGTWHEGYRKFDNLKDLIEGVECDVDTGENILGYVIVEPVMLDLSVKTLLKKLRKLCTERGIVLIFDEIITGFRVPQYCVANFFDIEPDLICLGKAMGNGFPISCVGGKAEFMDTPGYFISSTFAGEHSAIRAAIGTLTALTPKRVQDLWDTGEWFQEQFNKLSPRVQLYGYPTRAVWKGTEEDKAIFMQEMYKCGVLYGKAWWISHSHSRTLLKTELKQAKAVFKAMDAGTVKLEGELPVEIFRRN